LDAAVTVERTTGGALRVTCEAAPGWALVVRTPVELARAVTAGWQEAAVAEYARRKQAPYDITLHDNAAGELAKTGRLVPIDPDARDAAIATLACAAQPDATGRAISPTYDAMEWQPLADGRWVSPAGRVYGSQTQVAQRIIAKRAAMGIDTPV
jgi:hypothetical protein